MFPRRLVAGVGSAVNWLAQTRAGVALSVVLSAIVGTVGVGVALALSAVTATVGYVTSGVSLALSLTGSTLASLGSGVSLSAAPTTASPVASQTPAFEVVRFTVGLTGTYGATAAATNVSGTVWANPANASGTRNGTVSTHNGALSAQHAYLTFTYPTFPNKSSLTVTSAVLRFYVNQGGTVANNGLLRLTWGTTANPDTTNVLELTGNGDYLTTPFEVNLFAAGLTTFAQLETVAARVRGILAAGAATVTQSVDAVELVVTATRTDAL